MSGVVFFCDEDVPAPLIAYLLSREPALGIGAVGQPGFPPKGTPDPELLRYVEAMGFALISGDKKTMPDHVADHLVAGGHVHGVFLLRSGYPVKGYADDLLLIWSSTDAEEWLDRLEYLPW